MPLLGPNIVKALLESVWLKRKGLGLAFTVNGTSFNSTIFGLFFSAATTDTKWKRHFKSKAPFQNLLREKNENRNSIFLKKKTFVIFFEKKMKNDKKIRRWRWTMKNVGCWRVSSWRSAVMHPNWQNRVRALRKRTQQVTTVQQCCPAVAVWRKLLPIKGYKWINLKE